MNSPISNYMTVQPHSVAPTESLENAKNMMEKYRIRHLPVLGGGEIIGLISERDFSLVHLYEDMDLKKSKVEDLMIQQIYTIDELTPLSIVVENMIMEKIGSAIITSKGKLSGIFTSIDALKVVHWLATQ